MDIGELIYQFILIQKRKPAHANELLDYIQKSYMQGDLTIKEYKALLCELDRRSAKKPIYYTDHDCFFIQTRAQ
ncbi:YppF family protein [Bacillus xiapuensis]|uniref:YppF family protein n=1 Tax=Bacillus xiapuensis TaxID=2014075 RepID=UPI000C24F981|nr:YppF family protein [Bacillus xiapuensis]